MRNERTPRMLSDAYFEQGHQQAISAEGNWDMANRVIALIAAAVVGGMVALLIWGR